MIAALRTRDGEVGALSLYREPGQPCFDQDELAFVKNLAPHLAEGARRALLVGEATGPDRADGPGLVILTGDWHVESTTAGVDRWLADLPDGNWEAGQLPTSIVATFPADFDIFSPVNWSIPFWVQIRAKDQPGRRCFRAI